MKLNIISILLLLGIVSCAKQKQDDTTSVTDSLPATTINTDNQTQDSISETNANGDYETYYVVVADTSVNYYPLHEKMFSLSKALPAGIDTMGRYFNKAKNAIVLPDDDEDEMYAGEYYPRRYPGNTLSLEYLSSYKTNTDSTTIALVTGIFETKKSADSAQTILQKHSKNSFVLKSEIYVGCMH